MGRICATTDFEGSLLQGFRRTDLPDDLP